MNQAFLLVACCRTRMQSGSTLLPIYLRNPRTGASIFSESRAVYGHKYQL